MTPAQLNIIARARGARLESELEARKAEIYNLAALIRPMIWSKDPPSFESVFPSKKSDRGDDAMDDEELLSQVRMLAAALGGSE